MSKFYHQIQKQRTIASVLFLLTVIVVLSIRASTKLNEPGANYPELDPANWALRDFRDAIYYPVRAMLDGNNPYDTQRHVEQYPVGQHFPLYSPVTLLVHLPFGMVPFEVAQWCYFATTIILTLVLASVIIRICKHRPAVWSVAALGGCLLISRPGHMNLLLGQTTVLVVLCSIGALHWSRSRPWLAGLLLAISTFKPTYGCLLFLLMLARRNFRAAFIGLAIGVVITIPLVLYFANMQGGVAEFAQMIGNNSQSFDENPGRNPLTSFSRIDGFALVSRISGYVASNQVEYLAALVTVLLICAVVWCFSHSGERLPNEREDSAAGPEATLIYLTMLFSIYHHAYDLLLVALPLVSALIDRESYWQSIPKPAKWVFSMSLGWTFVNYLSTNSIIKTFEIEGRLWTLITCLNGMALLVCWVISIFVVVGRFRQKPENHLRPD